MTEMRRADHGRRIVRRVVCGLLATLVLLAGCSEPDRPTIELYLAVHRGDINQIERHIYWGADINAINADGRTPLHVAAAQGQTAVVKLLLKHGARVDVLDRQGDSALHDAIIAGRTQIADLLLRHGAPVDAGRMLRTVVRKGVDDRDVMEWLARNGADFNQPDSEGMTPLIRAVEADNRVMVKLLIEQGAEVNRAAGDGRLPLEFADPVNQEYIYRMLKKHGAVGGREED